MITTYTIKQVADQLQVHEDTVKNIIKSGALSAAKIGRAWRVSEPDLLTFFKNKSIQTRKTKVA